MEELNEQRLFLKKEWKILESNSKYDVSFILIYKKLKIDLMKAYVIWKVNMNYMMN